VIDVTQKQFSLPALW